jgi:hypothetical protein
MAEVGAASRMMSAAGDFLLSSTTAERGMQDWLKTLGAGDGLRVAGSTAASRMMSGSAASKAFLSYATADAGVVARLKDIGVGDGMLASWDELAPALPTIYAPSSMEGATEGRLPTRTVQAIGLGAYQIEALIFLMLFIWMLSVQMDVLFGATTSLSDRAIAVTEILAVAGLPSVSVAGVRKFIEQLRS